MMLLGGKGGSAGRNGLCRPSRSAADARPTPIIFRWSGARAPQPSAPTGARGRRPDGAVPAWPLQLQSRCAALRPPTNRRGGKCSRPWAAAREQAVQEMGGVAPAARGTVPAPWRPADGERAPPPQWRTPSHGRNKGERAVVARRRPANRGGARQEAATAATALTPRTARRVPRCSGRTEFGGPVTGRIRDSTFESATSAVTEYQ